MRTQFASRGFTLVELSMVLVIIGLLVAGVQTGYDLIVSARISATAQQYNKLVSAVNAFDTKYNALPGDIGNAKVNQFELHLPGVPCVGGFEDGCESPQAWTDNGFIDKGTREQGNFYQHLSRAGLVKGGPFSYSGNGSGDQAFTWMVDELNRGVIYPEECPGYGRCFVMGITFANIVPGAPPLDQANKLSPVEAFGLDIKLDNGNPGSGFFRTMRKYEFWTIPFFCIPPVGGGCSPGEDTTPDGQCIVPPGTTCAIGIATGPVVVIEPGGGSGGVSEECCIRSDGTFSPDVDDYCSNQSDYNMADTVQACTVAVKF